MFISKELNESDKIELRSEEVQEILSRPPHALIRYGISIICGVILLLFVGSFFFRYPDVVQGKIMITTENPPVWIVAKSSGKIKELLCSDQQVVKQGDLLAVIDNSASTSDVITMNQLLSTIIISDSSFFIPKEFLTQPYELGEIQSSFSSFSKAAMDYTNFLSLNLIYQEKISLHKQILERKTYSTNLQMQLELKKKDLNISKSAYERDKLLFKQKVISESEMETSEQTYLNKQQEFQQEQTSISLEQVESTQLQGSVEKLSIQYLQEKNQLLTELKSSYRELITAIENWQQNYVLVAPQSGNVTFNSFWKINQNINIGDRVFAIISQNPGQLIGKIQVLASGSGKIHIGQLVNVKADRYPYLEYGILQGRTNNISLVPNNGYYTVEVIFPKGLYSTMNKKWKFTGELSGTAEIVTENHSLFERIVYPLKYLAKKNYSQ